jgi:hypothetical protein
MTTDAKVQRRLLKRAWGSSRLSLFVSGMSEMGLGCVKTPKLNLRTEISSRLQSI